MRIKSEYGKILLRVSLSLVFLWFGISQLYSPITWIGFVPTSIPFSPGLIVMANGSLEIALGLMLLTGIYTRFASLILGLHLFGISLSLGLSALAIRDYGLALATLSIFLQGPDKWCIDTIMDRSKEKEIKSDQSD